MIVDHVRPSVFLFLGLFGQNPSLFEEAVDILQRRFGPVLTHSTLFDFTHTDYYREEMGSNLKKMFYVFKKPILPESLPRIKLYTIKVEAKFALATPKKNGRIKRTLNLDPGYLSLGKVVLASTKDYSHRLYLGRGIYGEVTLFFKDKSYNPYPWTYPDYRTPEYINFFNQIRKMCYNKKGAEND